MLVRQGIESSYDRDRRKARNRLERTIVQEKDAVVPGIEVTYLELDPHLFELDSNFQTTHET